jgi:serine phosphatase RsbU (regulator of sigma subunit)
MLKLKIVDWKKPSTKIIITVFSALFLLSGYFIFYIHFHFLSVSENKNLERLHAIAKTVAMQINGDNHSYLANKYKKSNELKDNKQDSIYYSIWKPLRKAYDINHLTTEIATLVLDEKQDKFYYVVNSTDKPYIHDQYIKYHKEFLEDYKTGNVIHQYNDEYGVWLTAFSPIHNAEGKVTGIVEVDENFDSFIVEAYKNLLTNLILSIFLFIITVIVLLRYIRVIMVAEEESKKQIEFSNQIISQKNKDILDSINYARRIQTAILAPKEEVFEVFKDAFILYKPKDIVSGDFYYFSRTENRAIIAAVDCTGHGVPGALMSMIGNDLLNHITHEKKVEKPSEILDLLHQGVTNILKQDEKHSDTKDGMDIALLSFDFKKKILEYAGAYRSLCFVRNGKMTEIKADKFPIGNVQQERTKFTNHELDFQQGDMFYFYTDGYADQFGGDKGKKFMVKRFHELLVQLSDKEIKEQEKTLDDTIETWKANTEQVDDILVIGIRI